MGSSEGKARSPVMPGDFDWAVALGPAAAAFDGRDIVLDGWLAPIGSAPALASLCLSPEPPCCLACVATAVMVGIRPTENLDIGDGAMVRVAGTWRAGADGRGIEAARIVERVVSGAAGATRRGVIKAGAALGLVLPLAIRARPALAGDPASTPEPDGSRRFPSVTVDVHSHAGRVLAGRRVGSERPLMPLAQPMRDGGQAVICLAIVADTSVTTATPEHRIVQVREPEPGELYAWSGRAFARLHRLVAAEGLGIVTDAAGLAHATADAPQVIVTAEGGDFLEGDLDRVDEAYQRYGLRQLQLTHYRVNELGDIQTVAPVHGGLTDFGAEVIRRCNHLGVVVDVAHGTLDLVKRAAAVSDKPLVLSHTSLVKVPPPRTRRISADHARIIAETGGVVGVWPPAPYFPDLDAYAMGIARMAEVIGADHVGIGSDMMGLLTPAAFSDYRQLPALAAALTRAGFTAAETAGVLGGNYARVFRQAMA